MFFSEDNSLHGSKAFSITGNHESGFAKSFTINMEVVNNCTNTKIESTTLSDVEYDVSKVIQTMTWSQTLEYMCPEPIYAFTFTNADTGEDLDPIIFSWNDKTKELSVQTDETY